MNSLPRGDFNMPPGVRVSDIPGNRPSDKRAECDTCQGLGKLNLSSCCGRALKGAYFDTMICPDCNDHCEQTVCEDCNGTGFIN